MDTDELRQDAIDNKRHWNGMNDEGFSTDDYRESVSAPDTDAMFTLAYQWQDKKHRHVFDLCEWIDTLLAKIDRLEGKE